MKKRIPKSFTLLLFFFLLSNYLSATPDCPILTGKVTTADRTTSEKGPCTVSSITVTAAAGNGGVLTCTNPSLGLSATAAGSGTTTWNWSGPNGYTTTQQNPTITTAGTYTVVATNSSGTGSASVTVSDNKTAPDITATGGILACSRVIALTAKSTVSEVTYNWTGPNDFTSNESDPSVSEAGAYTVLVTNPANGCSNQQSVSVIAGAAIPSTLWLEDFNGLSNGATSDAGATAWTAITSGGGTYSVQNNEFKASFSGQAEGVWTSQEINISGKRNVYLSVDLRSEATPNHSFNTLDYIRIYFRLNGGEEILAFEDLAGIGSSTTGTASTTFDSWELRGSTLQVIIKTNNSAGNERYYFDNIKVVGSDFVTENVTATGGVINCAPSSITLSGNAAPGLVIYYWTGPDNFVSTEQNPVVTAPGIYTLDIKNWSTGCSGTDTALVVPNSGPGACASASGTLSCTGTSSVTLSGSSSTSGVTYSWTGLNNFTSAAQNPVVTTIGPYNLTVTDPATGCTSTATVNVTTSISSTGSVWSENFTLPNGTTTGTGASTWSITTNPSSTLFSVLNNEMRISNSSTTGEGVWTSGVIDVTGKTDINISAGVRSAIINGAVMNTDPTNGDYIRFYYKPDNGAEVLFAERTGGINNHSTTPTPVSVTGLSGAGSLQIVVRVRATGKNEFYYFDNVQVVATSHTPLNAEATATDILTCTRNSVDLTGSSPATSPVIYNWTGPNNFTSTTQNPTATAAGVYTLTVTDCATGCTASDTALISLNNTPPGACASAFGTLDCNSGSSATLYGSSSTSCVTFNWTGPNNFTSNEQNLVVTVAGTYNLTVTDPVNGCTSTASATVTNDNSFTTTWNEDFILPDGSISDAGATPWTTSKTVSAAEIAVHNNHLRITNCTTTGEAVWTSGAIDVTGKTYIFIRAGVRSSVINGAAMTTDPVYGDYIRIYYKLDNGNEVLFGERTGDIAWHSETPSRLPTGLFPGGNTTLQIIVRARATGNDEFYYVDFVEVTATGPANLTASATGGTINCINKSVALQGSAAPSGVSYAWSGPDGYTSSAQNPVVTKEGTYTLAVARGACTDTAAATVIMDTTKPNIVASANPIKITCVVTSSTLTGSSTTPGVSYSWRNASGVISGTANASVNMPGIYTLTVTNPVNGCSSTRQVTVTQDIEKPTGATATHAGTITCTTPSIGITATISIPNLTYSWSGPDNFTASTLNASVTRGGTYIFTATNPNNGCYDTAITVVQENTARPGEISINNSGTITCLTRNVTISGSSSSSGVNYKWEGPNNYSSNSSSATVSRGGIYTLTATNPQNGCTSSKSTTVAENTTAPVINITNTSPISCANPNVNLTANNNTMNATYLWLGPEDYVAVTKTIEVNIPGTYIITVTNPANGCLTNDFVEVTEDYSDCTARRSTNVGATKAAEQNTPVAVVTSFTHKAYPNPVITNGVIEFTTPQSANATVDIYNALGTCEKVLFKGNVTAGRQYRVAVPATQLSAGPYYYIINTGSKTYTGKLMIVK